MYPLSRLLARYLQEPTASLQNFQALILSDT